MDKIDSDLHSPYLKRKPKYGSSISRSISFRALASIVLIITLLYFYVYRLSISSFSISFFNSELEDRTSGDIYNLDQKEIGDYGIEYYDLESYSPHADGWNRHERVLFLVPLRDAAQHLPMFFSNMKNLTYPHHLIDLAFLVSDTKDSTIKDLKKKLNKIQKDPNPEIPFGRINIYEKNFGQIIGQSFSDRHGFAAQGPRRKLMAIARNWLLTTALRPDHSWVYWRDADVETVPSTIIEDLMHHDKDVIVPNIWRPLPDWLGHEQPYDLNSWQESEGGLDLAETLDEDAVIVEGYPEYATWRVHLGYLRDPFGDPETEVNLDGIGGVSILAKGEVFKSGAMFPAFSYLKHAETEGFGKLSRTMGFSVVGLPHYVIWHIYEPSVADLQHMKWMAEEKKNRAQNAKIKRIYNKRWEEAFMEVEEEWNVLKFNVFKNTDLGRKINLDWNDVDGYLRKYEMSDEEKFPELVEQKEDTSLNAMNKRFKGGYIPSAEIFDGFPINPINRNDQFRFVRFEDEEKEKEILDGEIANGAINSNNNEEKRLKKLLEMKEEEKIVKEEAISELRESQKEVENEVKQVEYEAKLEMKKAKQREMTGKELEDELARLSELYSQKKKESEMRKLKAEAERLNDLVEAKKQKKLEKIKLKKSKDEAKKKQALEKETERRRKLAEKQKANR